jgi:magnesium-transporting ATPase (P-type)
VKTAAATPLRMIAFAFAEMNIEDWQSRFETGDGCPEKLLEEAMRGNEIEFTLVGVFGLSDSIRSMVPSCVKHVREGAQMMVRMVSGDHLETARKVAKKSGILDGKEAMHDYAVLTGE